MKKLILAVLAFLAATAAQASTDVNISFSSGVISGVTVSSGTAFRVDNWTRGAQNAGYTTLDGRSGILIENLDSTYNIWCAVPTGISTVPTISTSTLSTANLGLKVEPGDTAYVGVMQLLPYYCKAEDGVGASGAVIHATQVARP